MSITEGVLAVLILLVVMPIGLFLIAKQIDVFDSLIRKLFCYLKKWR
jgi:hypothetical protein